MSFYNHNHILNSPYNYSLPNDTLTKQSSSFASTKDQISQLEERLSNYELQYTKQNSSLNEQIKQLLINDSNMKRELENKAKALFQAEHRFNEASNELLNVKAYMKQTDIKYRDLYQKYTELTLESKNASLSLQSLEEENNELKATIHQLDLELSLKIEEHSDTKMKYQSIEKVLQETKANTELMSKESNTIKEMVNECQKENQRMTKEMAKLRHDIEERDKELNEAKREIEQLDYNNNALKSNSEEMLKTIGDYEKKIEDLEAELLKTKEINVLVTDTTKRKDNEISNKNRTAEEMESLLAKKQIDLTNIIGITNENIEAICRWIQNYFDGNYKDNDILPELQLISYCKNSSNGNKNEPINFAMLKELLRSAKINYDKLMTNEAKRSNDLQKCQYDIEKDNADKTKTLQSILNILQNEVGDYAQYDNRAQFNCGYKETIQLKIEGLLGILVHRAKGYNSNSNANDQDDTALFIAQLKQDNEQLCYEISQLHSELNYFKSQINSSTDMVYQLNKLNEEKMSIEKKNKYLLNEIELKKAQIKSQEQMLSRRMNDEAITKQIELDKDNLIKDNLMLIAQNAQLKEQVKYYQSQTIKQ